MPYAAKRPCSHGGCPEFQPCPKHTGRDKQRRAQYEANRGSRIKRGYDATWLRFSAQYRALHPYCLNCLRYAHVRASTQTDHIIPLALKPELKFDDANLEALCSPCHARKTRGEKTGGVTWHPHVCSRCRVQWNHPDAFCKRRDPPMLCNACIEGAA